MLIELSLTDLALIFALPICAVINYLLGHRAGIIEGAERLYTMLEEHDVLDEKKLEEMKRKAIENED